MFTVIPVSLADKHLLPTLHKALSSFPPGRGHDLLVVGSPNARTQLQEAVTLFSPFFRRTATHILHCDNAYGWPRACNHYFQLTCYHIGNYVEAHQGWLWLELDSTPLKIGWLDEIEAAYYSERKKSEQEHRPMRRYMGVRERTLKSYGGELMERSQAGDHMASVGVYPGDIASSVKVLSSMGSQDVHFPVHMRWYSNKSLNETSLIQNNRETSNYREEEGKIVCDSISRNAWDIHWNNPLSAQAVLLHGDKSGSLTELVAKEIAPIIVQPVSEEPEPAPKPEPPALSAIAERNLIEQKVMAEQTQSQAAPSQHPQLRKPAKVMTLGERMAAAAGGGTPITVVTGEDAVKAIKEGTPQESPVIAPIVAPIAVPEAAPQPVPEPPVAPPAAQKPVPRSKPRGKRKQLTLSDEERKRRGDRMRQMAADRKAAKTQLAPV